MEPQQDITLAEIYLTVGSDIAMVAKHSVTPNHGMETVF